MQKYRENLSLEVRWYYMYNVSTLSHGVSPTNKRVDTCIRYIINFLLVEGEI